jgi:protein TonB
MLAGAPRSRAVSFLAAGLLHGLVLALAAVLTGGTSAQPSPARLPSAAVRRVPPPRLVFVARQMPGGGGGGGGNREAGPIRQAHAPGHDAVTVRPARPVVLAQTRSTAAPVGTTGEVVLDAVPLGSGGQLQPGLPSGGVDIGHSLGPGSGGGVGTGTGTGVGPGTGSGLGAGSGGGTGGGVYRAGGGVTAPRVLVQSQPKYTDTALAARVQGTVELELVVDRHGRPTRIRVVRTLDPGLDQEAVAAVSRWRFEPGHLGDEPVDVLVTVLLDFHIR